MAAKKTLTWWHGGPKITDWSALRWERERGRHDQNADGPGMYWTTDPKEAATYGRHMYAATMKPSFRLLPVTRPTMPFLVAMFQSASADDRETFLSDWGLEPNQSPVPALTGYLSQPTILDAAVMLFHDLFHYNADAFVAAMRKHFDGAIVDQRTRLHLVNWSPDRMNIRSAK